MKNKNLRIKIILKYNSQAEFAMVAGFSESKVSRVIAGRMKLTPGQQERWADLLGCSVDVFQV